jgi:predicted RecA/RadA family phage recombinase
MKNKVKDGKDLQVAAPVGGYTGGMIYAVGKLVGVAVSTVAEGELCTLDLSGAFNNVPKAASESWAIGDMLYLKADGTALTKTSTSNTFAGYAHAVAASDAVVGEILLSH